MLPVTTGLCPAHRAQQSTAGSVKLNRSALSQKLDVLSLAPGTGA
jgi:hypothetical protein